MKRTRTTSNTSNVIPQTDINLTIDLLRQLNPIPTDLILRLMDAKKVFSKKN